MAAANEGGSVPFIARVSGIRVGPHPYSERRGTKLMIYSRFYFPGVLVGPYLEYAAYTSLVNETLFRAYEGKTTDAPSKSRRAIPRGRKRVAYRKALFGLIFLGLYTTFSSSFNYSIAITNWFLKQNILYR